MAGNLHVLFLPIVVISSIYLTQCSACDLVPSNVESCFGLAAIPYITSATSQFGPTIEEGASVNPAGDIFAVNYGTAETIYQLGQVFPQQKLFYSDVNQASMFNGVRFLNAQAAFTADARNYRVLKLNVSPGNVVSSSENYCSNIDMIQPNDLTLSKTGTVFRSGMLWIDDTNNTHGDIWSCLPDGSAKRLKVLGRTNGIDLTPDEQYLYVSESYNSGGQPVAQKIWRYRSNVADGTISMKELFVDFEILDNTAAFDIDGMKTDIQDKKLIGKIALNFQNPTNLEFGGPNGTTLFIVGQCDQPGKGCVDQIDVVTPGRSWNMLQASSARSVLQIINYVKAVLIILQLFLATFTNHNMYHRNCNNQT